MPTLFFLVPLFKVISPEKGEFTLIALCMTSAIVAFFMYLLWEVIELLKEIDFEIKKKNRC